MKNKFRRINENLAIVDNITSQIDDFADGHISDEEKEKLVKTGKEMMASFKQAAFLSKKYYVKGAILAGISGGCISAAITKALKNGVNSPYSDKDAILSFALATIGIIAIVGAGLEADRSTTLEYNLKHAIDIHVNKVVEGMNKIKWAKEPDSDS